MNASCLGKSGGQDMELWFQNGYFFKLALCSLPETLSYIHVFIVVVCKYLAVF
jgi:hypothetical protein